MTLADVLAHFVLYYLLLIFAYSVEILEILGFQIMSDDPMEHPHWIIEWVVYIVVSIIMTISLVLIIRRFLLVMAKIYRNFKTIYYKLKKFSP